MDHFQNNFCKPIKKKVVALQEEDAVGWADTDTFDQCGDHPPLLPCIKHIALEDITCSSTWLRSLVSTLLTLDHAVMCKQTNCDILSCKEDAVRCADKWTNATLSFFNHTLNLSFSKSDRRGLWEALHGLNIKSLRLRYLFRGLQEEDADSMSLSLLSLTHLNTLCIEVKVDSPGLWEALHGLNIKSLSVGYGGFNVNQTESMSQSLSSLTHLDTLSIEANDYSPDLWEAVRGRNIYSPSICGRYGGWEALHGLNIKSLRLRYLFRGLQEEDADSMSLSLSSLTHLDALSIEVDEDSPGLWKALHGLNIKSLSLSRGFRGFNVNYADWMSQSLSLLFHLDTLIIKANGFSLGLWEALRGLNIMSLSLSGKYVYLNKYYADSLSQSLSSLLHLETLSIEVYVDSPGLWKALHGLNINSLSLGGQYGYFTVNHAESLVKSLSSL
ncbi:hypothetical protein DPMN_152196 [Dreissena polymorpha]|uniref:Uncharacterized protein n=1 Tax=Dreissena polymorpha TaxID=45954 RepID=A0A9D4FKV4_DREPO|nr:hypothetical protein DPMN_152196 [Dreissena polymorpha]